MTLEKTTEKETKKRVIADTPATALIHAMPFERNTPHYFFGYSNGKNNSTFGIRARRSGTVVRVLKQRRSEIVVREDAEVLPMHSQGL